MASFNNNDKLRLRRLGISSLHALPFGLPDRLVLEPPCSLKWIVPQVSLYCGAFSYAVSGYFFATNIGRYTSIGEDVQIGRGSHPVHWASTSPFFYQNYRAALDIEWEAAERYQPTAPHIGYRETRIGNDVYIGHGALIMQGVSIGDGAVIGARSVVTKDVPPYSVAAGCPASIRKMRFNDGLIDRFIALRWWDYAFWDFGGAKVEDPVHFIDVMQDKIENGLVPYRPTLVFIDDVKPGESKNET